MSNETFGVLCKVDVRRRAKDNITHDEALDFAAMIIASQGVSSREKAVMILRTL